jgi:hypothetical protein
VQIVWQVLRSARLRGKASAKSAYTERTRPQNKITPFELHAFLTF